MNAFSLLAPELSRDWVMPPNELAALVTRIESVGNIDAAAIEQTDTDLFGNPLPRVTMRDGVAVVPISGPMLSASSRLSRRLGFTSYGDIEAMTEQAVSQKPERIIFNMDSPGGVVPRCPECADRMAELTTGIKTQAFTNSQMTSGAYWLASVAADEIVATPSSVVGSVGVITSSTSIARMLQASGIDVTVFTSGEFKAAGHMATTLSENQKTYIQQRVDSVAADFKNAVNRRRSIDDGNMQGQVFYSSVGRQNGFVDRLVNNFSELLGNSSGGSSEHLAAGGNRPGLLSQGAVKTCTAPTTAGIRTGGPLSVEELEQLGQQAIDAGRGRVSVRKTQRFTAEDFK
jgi:signal peptide peptidase SppA